ncbi:MAG: glycosyltransferase family 2 protein [Thermodesulfobacteriota bacterium]
MHSISVIIPCHNNQRVLPWILRALRASECAGLEIICVDDASAEDIAPIVETFGARYIRLGEGEPGRRAMARNLGHQVAHGQVTLYLDGDIVPEPRIIRAAIHLHARHRKVVVKYPVYSIPEQDHTASIGLLAPLVISQDLPRLGPFVTKHCGIDTRPLPRRLRGKKTNIWVLCASHCTSIERHEVEDVGGWDESFLGWGEEDLELAYRLHLNGLSFVYPHRKHGAAYHLDHPTNWDERLDTLDRNVRYFRQKFPTAWSGRRSLLRFFLEENNLPQIPAIAAGFSDQA